MQVATDPNISHLDDSDDEFGKAFEEFAAGKKEPAPDPESKEEPGEPGGNGPDEKDPAPAEEEGDTSPAATEENSEDDATPGDAKPEGGSQPPEGDKAPDLWADAPDELKAAFAKVQEERDAALHKAKSDANRVAALSRKLSEVTTAPPAPTEAPADKPTEAQLALDEKVKQLRTDYGEIAEPLIELIEQQRQELSSVRTVLTGLSQERQSQVIATEQQALAERHPDWQQIAAAPEFQSWLEVQPKNIQGLASSWDARETSVVLTLFKAEQVETKGQKDEPPVEEKPKANAATGVKRSQQLDGGRDVGSRPAPAASDAPEGDFDAAFRFFADKRAQKERQQSGR